MLRQALYHALLKASLQASPGWQAWTSDWQQAQIGIEQPDYQRRIQLQPADDQELHAELDDSEAIPLLKLYLPDQLSAPQQLQISKLLAHWALELHSSVQMQQQIAHDNLDYNRKPAT